MSKNQSTTIDGTDKPSNYDQRGVSAQKTDVHNAIAGLEKGLFPNSFCQVYPDLIEGNPEMCCISHCDGAGTKSILAYLYYKESLANGVELETDDDGNLLLWKNIAIDSMVMNIDDLLCVGATDNFVCTSTIGRNKHLIDGTVISSLIRGSTSFCNQMSLHGISMYMCGGETADIGDLVRTVVVDGNIFVRQERSKIITNSKIREGDCIVSFSSSGKATYETSYNSGIGCNGLTSARHDLLCRKYPETWPECVDPAVPANLSYCGKYNLFDTIEIIDTNQIGVDGKEYDAKFMDENDYKRVIDLGHLILSPTRTYAPLVIHFLKNYFNDLHGIIHCTGGGQTKILHYLPDQSPPLDVVKDNLLPVPKIFEMIQKSSNTSWKEMYQVFNMGQRLEIYTDRETAEKLVNDSKVLFNIDARISGSVKKSSTLESRLFLKTEHGEFEYKL